MTDTARHRVVAKTTDGRFVTLPQLMGLDWYEAQAKWNVLDGARRAGRLPLVDHLVVRSEDDPDPRYRVGSFGFPGMKTLGQATFDLIPFVVGRQRGFKDDTPALRKWGRAHGYVGRSGGWIDRSDGRTAFQGWGSIGHVHKRQFPVAGHGSYPDRRYYVNDLDSEEFTRALYDILPKTEVGS